MEALGESLVGYNEEIKRSEQFGLKYLRLGRPLEPGFVLTVEPGLYFIPQLIKTWKEQNKFVDFINYDEAEKHFDFGGVRIEDNILVPLPELKFWGNRFRKLLTKLKILCKITDNIKLREIKC
jgi:Xaa-Pro aminopeptidase